MPPTLKDNSPVPTSPEAERSSEAHSSSAEAGVQPVALEVPVTVNGARTVEGSEKREPFSETTSTVLVLVNGAVIRLSSSVAPGQLLFLTNDKTRKEVVCQVVKSKNYRSASGYVELEFTEPVLGFWGMRFPGDRTTATTSLAAPRKSDPAAAEPAKSADPKTSSYADTRTPAETVTENLADAVEEFKTEIKADSRSNSKADFLAPSESSVDGLKLEANRLQEQLSALLFAEQKEAEAKPSVPVVPPSKQELAETAPRVFEIANEEPPAAKEEIVEDKAELRPAPAAPKETPVPAKSSFDSEEVKIPAWLEPLARNANVHAPREEEAASDSANKADNCEPSNTVDSSSFQKPAAATTKKPTNAPTSKPSAAVFGNSLMGGATSELSKPHGSSKGIWLAIAAGLVLAAASGAWYFRDSLGLAGQSITIAGTHSIAATVAPSSHSAAPVNQAEIAPPVTNTSSANIVSEPPAAISAPATRDKLQTTALTERIPKTKSANEVFAESEKSIEVVEPEAKRPSLGKVRLAKPKVGRSASTDANGEVEPTLELSGETVSAGESSLGGNFAESKPTAPAAPVQVGGDVRPARMISSVPPVYPTLAKAQHVSGEVRVDALIDANGRVGTMKVVAGPSLLHQAAMDSLRQWKYQPATLDGKPVAMHLTVTIQFRLQ
jgi:TonB family protein